MSSSRLRAELLRRFPDRDALSTTELYHRFWAPAGLPEADVLALLQLLEQEWFGPAGLPVGLIRPADPVAALWPPVRTRDPLHWWACEPRFEDAAGELGYRLGLREERRGERPGERPVRTIEELVRAWCGAPPPGEIAERTT